MKILIPLDGSEYAEHALTAALKLSERSDRAVEIHLLMVTNAQTVQSRWHEAWRTRVDSILGDSSGSYPVPPENNPRVEEQIRRAAEDYLEEVSRRFLPHQAKKVVVIGTDPAGEIISYARREEVHLIALATRGRAALARLLLGSGVAPVVIVSPRKQTNEDTGPADELENGVWAGSGVPKQAA